MSDHERIYLEPSPGADEDYGRQWCQHNVWDEATEYVRADLHLALTEERDRLREENAALIDTMLTEAPWRDQMWARGALMIASRAIRRGRHLTDAEKMENLNRWVEDSDEGREP
jgi:hypothetical protein